jgi:hypothetical protein
VAARERSPHGLAESIGQTESTVEQSQLKRKKVFSLERICLLRSSGRQPMRSEEFVAKNGAAFV